MRDPGQLLRAMRTDLRASRGLAWRLFVRNVSARYRQTALGYLWAFLPPLATTLTFVFLNGQQVIDVGETAIPYPAFVLIGTTLWLTFVDALTAPLKLIESSREMLVKINFPREALILAAGLEVLFDLAVRSVLVVAVLVLYGIGVPPTVVLVPLGVAALIGLGIVLGLLVTPIGVLYEDVPRGLPLVTAFWMFLTPVVYPTPTDGPAALVAWLNPVTPLVVTTRDWLTTGAAELPVAFAVVALVTLALLAFGWIVYRLAMPHLIARLGDRT